MRSVKQHRPDRKAYRGGPQGVETSENSRARPTPWQNTCGQIASVYERLCLSLPYAKKKKMRLWRFDFIFENRREVFFFNNPQSGNGASVYSLSVVFLSVKWKGTEYEAISWLVTFRIPFWFITSINEWCFFLSTLLFKKKLQYTLFQTWIVLEKTFAIQRF